jgi:ABC-2 type transport system permease protein
MNRMSSLYENLSLIADYIKNYLKIRLTYRSDFWVEMATDLLFQAVNLVFILVVFEHIPLLAGWTKEEMIFIYGYFLIPYAFFSCFFNLWNFADRYIIKGEMDRVLTRPKHNLFQIVMENMDPPALFGVLTGGVVMIWAGERIGLEWSLMDGFILLLFIAGGTMVYGGLYTALASLSFYTDSKTGILPLMWNIQNYGRYPVNIYNKVIRFVLTWILPFAFVGFYPSAYFIDPSRSELAWFTPVVGVVSLGFGLLAWNQGVKRYRGAGS